MVYRLEWRLLGRDNRLLDSGEIDNGYPNRQAAVQALSAFLSQFPVWGREAENGCWWARRSPDADLKVCVILHEPERSEADLLPVIVAAQSGRRAALRS
jgi:hypothetical protein